ncbi:MAG TPA: N-acetylmuramoyl-L-alanine amidase [Pseudolabrys sp.]|nr:N-acetylmuramoyl-L-alanine amidase [Pseudolabrys sp.]
MFLFQPDSFVVSDVVASPNFDDRRDGIEPDMIILHYTGMQDEGAALARLCAPDSKVSSHYVVFADGRVVQCVPEKARAWHAGVSRWDNATDINSRSIGIEITNPGHDFDYPAFPLRQTAAVIAVCKGIMTRRPAVRTERVLAHSDVAPERKQDPGEKFPWALLADSGVGHWVRPAPLALEGPRMRAGDKGSDVSDLQTMLAEYGYGIAVTGDYDEATAQVVTAFQRHFRPERVDGIADTSTRMTLRALLETRPARSA